MEADVTSYSKYLLLCIIIIVYSIHRNEFYDLWKITFLYISVNTQAHTLFSGIETYVKHFSSKINSHIIKNEVRLACKHDLVKTAISEASDMQIQSLIYNK